MSDSQQTPPSERRSEYFDPPGERDRQIALENKKRKRERRVAYFILVAFVITTIVQAVLTNRKEAYGFVQSLLYFALVHLNVILIMFLVFLVSRNLIKAYMVRRTGKLGSSLRWKMVSSLLAFSLLPSVLLFAGSSYVIRQGFDRWFSGQVSRALEDAQAITDVHYSGLQSNLEFFSEKVRASWTPQMRHLTVDDLKTALAEYPIQSLEVYLDMTSPPLRAAKKDVPDWAIPRAAVESLQRSFAGQSFDLIRQFGDGDLVQRFVPLKLRIAAPETKIKGSLPGLPIEQSCVLVLSQNVPLGLKTRIADLRQAFSGYKQTVLFKESLKANYTLILLTLFVLILFVVSWFGLYIAKSVTEPVLDLMKATEAFKEGEWSYRIPNTMDAVQALRNSGFGADLEVLKSAFNTMAEEVGQRGRKLEEANVQLTSLVKELEERERYLEILLSSIRRGVLVLDPKGRIQRINSEALEFSSFAGATPLELASTIGRPWREVFESLSNHEDIRTWLEEAKHFKGRPVDRIFEVGVGKNSESVLRSVRATGIGLLDENGDSLGWLLILEDVSNAARLEKLAAWQEVAKRVAHEIKNPLTPIQISADRLQRRLGDRMQADPDDGPIFAECIGQIQKQVRVIRDLVREFSQFAKLPEPQFKELALVPLLEQIIADYRFTHPSVDFKVLLRDSGLPTIWVRVDPEYLRRLVVNLADNAIHSMDEAKVKAPMFHVIVGLNPGYPNFAQVIFEDNGPGIETSLREKIFDPYVTSKASGLGLGLPIVRRIAIEHAGRIRCEESASGARFVLELPRLASKDAAQQDGQVPTHR